MRRLLFVVMLLVTGMAWGEDKPAKGLAGNWEGAITVGAVKLRLAFKILAKPDGGYSATMDSVDQGAKDIKLDEASLENGKVVIKHKLAGMTYEGKLNDAGAEIEGEFQQSTLKLPLTLKRVDKLTELKRPQEPKKPFPYREEEVTIDNAKAEGVKLAGTLTLPKGDGPFGCAILITGSGPQDRDESLLGHKPFLVLADNLTRRGIAVLRCDDRGVAKSTGKFGEATSADFATDAEAQIAYLKTRKEIDSKKIGLIGHSEGGLIAPMIAARSNDVAFIVMLAGPGLSGEAILLLQGQAILKAMGATPDALATQKAMQLRIFKLLAEEKDNAAAEKKLKVIIEEELAKIPEAERKKAGANTAEQALAQTRQVMSPWFRYFLPYDPVPALKATKCPVLAIIGERDLQVPPKENNPVIEAALKAGGNKDFTVKELPGLNHLFQASKTGTVIEYGEIEETINPAALELIGDWVVKHAK